MAVRPESSAIDENLVLSSEVFFCGYSSWLWKITIEIVFIFIKESDFPGSLCQSLPGRVADDLWMEIKKRKTHAGPFF